MENLEKFLGSRKFIIWVGMAILFGTGHVDQEFFKWITISYLGAQGGVDVVAAFRSNSWTAKYENKQ